MTDKEFRRLNRLDLVEIICRLQERSAELEKECQRLRETNGRMTNEINTLRYMMQNAAAAAQAQNPAVSQWYAAQAGWASPQTAAEQQAYYQAQQTAFQPVVMTADGQRYSQ